GIGRGGGETPTAGCLIERGETALVRRQEAPLRSCQRAVDEDLDAGLPGPGAEIVGRDEPLDRGSEGGKLVRGQRDRLRVVACGVAGLGEGEAGLQTAGPPP